MCFMMRLRCRVLFRQLSVAALCWESAEGGPWVCGAVAYRL
jgi:hypothetical protein